MQKLFGILFLLGSFSLFGETPLLIINSLNSTATLPNNFRSCSDLADSVQEWDFSLSGLRTLNASGSGQFSVEELGAIKNRITAGKIVIVDLREESHGYLNNIAVSWYIPKNWANASLDLEEIELDEEQRLQSLLMEREVTVHKILEKGEGLKYASALKLPIAAHYVATEEELCRSLNLSYFRIPITDHIRPTDEMVDRFILFAKSQTEGTWLHFHCSAGRGRATSFLAMYDMMQNAKTVSLADIVTRQWVIGGSNLLRFPSPQSWKYRYRIERQDFIKRFYQYCRENDDDFTTTWSQWTKDRKSLSQINL